MSDATQKSRLGSLLIRKGLLTQAQLDTALQAQLKSHLRLGEVLIEQGLLTERQLKKALKKQDRTRVLAAFMAVILGPMSFGAFASHSNSSESEQTSTSAQANANTDLYQGLKALDDMALDDIQGQGFQSTQDVLNSLMQQASDENVENDNNLGALDEVVSLLNPLSSMLDADISITGVKYNNQRATQIIHEDGSIELALPSEIEEIAFRDLRVKGAGLDRTFGDIVISGIKFSEQSSIRIRVNQ
jgi:hypothetical protein